MTHRLGSDRARSFRGYAMATQPSTQQPANASRSALLDPTVIRWAQPLIVIGLIFAQVGGQGAVPIPVLVIVGILAVAVGLLQVALYDRDRRAYAPPHPAQMAVTGCLLV